MPRFDFTSPGAGFVDQMTKALAERKADERQAMLDNLTKASEARAQQAEERANREAISMADYRKQQITESKEQAERAQAGELAQGLSMGDDPTANGMTPEQIQLLVRHGYLTQGAATPVPSVSTSETFTAPPDTSFVGPQDPDQPSIPATAPEVPPTPTPTIPRYGAVGTPQERERGRKKREQGRMLVDMLSSQDPEERQTGALLAKISNANDGEIPKEFLNYLSPKQRSYTMNAENGKMEYTTGPDGKPMMTRGENPQILSYTPHHETYHDMSPDVLTKLSPQGTLLTMDKQGRITDTGVRAGADPNEAPLGIPIGMYTDHKNDLAGILVPNPTASDVATYKSSAIDMITSAKGVSSDVRRLARIAVEDPNNFEENRAHFKLSDAEMADLKELLDVAVSPAAWPIIAGPQFSGKKNKPVAPPVGQGGNTAPIAAPTKVPSRAADFKGGLRIGGR